jgi:hypothetical protein
MGEFLTRAAIWLAMGLWTLAMTRSRHRAGAARWFWTAGLAAYVVHILLAYGSFYGWSHRIAWETTARDTAETVGLDSGFGLLVNFAFAAVLAADVVVQWRTGVRKAGGWIDAFVLFLILNGTVVFGEGAVRWYGGLLLVSICIVRCYRR